MSGLFFYRAAQTVMPFCPIKCTRTRTPRSTSFLKLKVRLFSRLLGKYKLKKSRRTDVEDLTPNPRKLLTIGTELRKLNKVISDLTPVSELPLTARPRSRKEKNKLASRYVAPRLHARMVQRRVGHCNAMFFDRFRLWVCDFCSKR